MDGALAGVVGTGLGRAVVGSERLPGGSQKGAYRLTLAGGGTAVLYAWSAEENWWPERDAPDDVFADATGLDLFLGAHAALTAAGVRVPALHWADGSHAAYPADLAVVEDVRGGSLEEVLTGGPHRGAPVTEVGRAAATGPVGELRAALARMAAVRDPRIGKVARPDRSGRDCPRIILDTARRDLAEAAERAPRIAAARSGLADRLTGLAAAVGPRDGHALVHGELGPDHVLLDDAGRPVVIDIEGAAFFDAEWEHAFIGLRFADPDALRPPGLDEDRLRFYRLARHLSLVAGPLRLAGTDFPDRDFMLAIAAHHTDRALAHLE